MQTSNVITAAAMATAVRVDPQFTVPARPRVPRELVFVPLADGLLADGTGEWQVLRGQATKTLLPRLLPLLDGTHTIDEVAALVPDLPAHHVQQAVALLYTRGLIEDGTDDPTADSERFDGQLLSFFRRHVDTTRVNRSAWQAARRLADAEVIVYAIAGDANRRIEPRASIAEQLRGAGVGRVTLGDVDAPLTRSAGGYRIAVAFVEGQDDRDRLETLDEACARLGMPWLRVAIDARAKSADVGPYFERGETACYECFSRIERAPHSTDHAVQADEAAMSAALWSAMLVIEAIALVSRIVPAASGLSTKRFDLTDWSSRTLQFPRLPGCRRCWPLDGVRAGDIPTALVYESAVRFPPRHLVDPKQHQAHYRPSNVELALDGKRYPSVEQLALPGRDWLARLEGATLDHLSTIAEPTTRLGVTELASLLLFGAGIRDHESRGLAKSVRPKRWAATGGNLGSPELYVVVREVEGLDPGVYFYQAHEHVLARLGSPSTAAEAALLVDRIVDRHGEPAPHAVIVATAALHRVSQKYGAFAYRVANLDAGVAIAQMQIVGGSLGLRTQPARRWDDEAIAERLDLNGVAEPVTGALLVMGHASANGGRQ